MFPDLEIPGWGQEKDEGARELGILQTREAMGPESNPDREGSEDESLERVIPSFLQPVFWAPPCGRNCSKASDGDSRRHGPTFMGFKI